MSASYFNDHYLTVPGFHGSGAAHWQTWLEHQLPNCQRLQFVDWEIPQLEAWARAIGVMLRRLKGRTWIIAHSFGCLASARAAALFPRQIAGILMVAPADPNRFDLQGPRAANGQLPSTLHHFLSLERLAVPGIVVGSENDPWMSLEKAQFWANHWQLDFINAGALGHINTESGHGPWPTSLDLVATLQEQARHSHFGVV